MLLNVKRMNYKYIVMMKKGVSSKIVNFMVSDVMMGHSINAVIL